MMTRMVDIISFDQQGHKHSVNAISGDMFKHIVVEHLLEGRSQVRGTAASVPDARCSTPTGSALMAVRLHENPRLGIKGTRRIV